MLFLSPKSNQCINNIPVFNKILNPNLKAFGIIILTENEMSFRILNDITTLSASTMSSVTLQ